MIIFQLLGRVRQEDCPKFEASLGYIVSDPVFKKRKKNIYGKIQPQSCNSVKIDVASLCVFFRAFA